MKRLLAIVLVLAMWLGTDLALLGAGKSVTNTTPAKTITKAKSKPFKGHLKSVDLENKVVVLEGAKAQTFQITSETKISNDDKPAMLKDIKTGDPVTGYAVEIADGKWEARSLFAGKHTPKD
jgi:hypothetical protein